MPQANSPIQGATPELLNPDLRPTPDNTSTTGSTLTPAETAAASQYRESVENLLVNESPLMISNSQPAHAAILFEKFFQHAKQQVRIFDLKLDARVFGQKSLVDQARAALLRGVTVKIITQRQPDDTPFVSLVREFPDSCVLSVVDSDNSLAITAKEMPSTFAVMDEKALRVEQEHKDMKAQAAMNRPDSAKRLVAFFDRLLAVLIPAEPGAAST